MRSISWMALVAGLAFSGSAFAGDAVVPPLLSKGVDPLVVLNLTSLVASEVDFQGGFGFVNQLDKTPATMNAACIANAGCLKGIANANNASALVGGTVSMLSGKLEFNLVFYDADADRIVRTKKFTLPNVPSVIADSMSGYVKELLTGKSQVAAAQEESMGDLDTVTSADIVHDEEEMGDDFGAGVPPSRPSSSRPAPSGLDSLPEEEDDEDTAAAAAAAAAAKKRAEDDARAAAAAAAAKKKAEDDARAAAAAKKAEDDARAAAAAKSRPAPSSDDDDIEFGKPADGDIQMEEITLGSAAGLIQMDGGDSDDDSAAADTSGEDDSESAAPAPARDSSRRPTLSSSSDDDEEAARPSARSSSRSLSDDSEEEDEDARPAARTSSRAVADEEDEDARPTTRSSTTREPTARTSTAREPSSRDDERSSSRDDERSSSRDDERSSSRARLEDDLGTDYDELDDLDGNARTTKSGGKGGKGGKGDDTKIGLAARLGYAGFQGLSFLTYGAEFGYSVSHAVALEFGLDAHSVKRDVPEALQQSQGYPATAWNTILPIHAGLQFRLGHGAAVPYLGADFAVIPGAVKGALPTSSDAETASNATAIGGRARLGLDLLFSDSFGLNIDASAGAWSSAGFSTVQADMKSSGFVPSISAGTVLRF